MRLRTVGAVVGISGVLAFACASGGKDRAADAPQSTGSAKAEPTATVSAAPVVAVDGGLVAAAGDARPEGDGDGAAPPTTRGPPVFCWDKAGYDGCQKSCDDVDEHCPGGGVGCLHAWNPGGEYRVVCHRLCEEQKTRANHDRCWNVSLPKQQGPGCWVTVKCDMYFEPVAGTCSSWTVPCPGP